MLCQLCPEIVDEVGRAIIRRNDIGVRINVIIPAEPFPAMRFPKCLETKVPSQPDYLERTTFVIA